MINAIPVDPTRFPGMEMSTVLKLNRHTIISSFMVIEGGEERKWEKDFRL
jgi:hypothetical protein